jgi:osmotically-inducible protein OsmY
MADQQPDHYLCEQVRQALVHDGRVGEFDIQVEIAAGKVFVTGSVATPERRDAVAEIVGGMLPDHELHNDVTVPPMHQTGEIEHL